MNLNIISRLDFEEICEDDDEAYIPYMDDDHEPYIPPKSRKRSFKTEINCPSLPPKKKTKRLAQSAFKRPGCASKYIGVTCQGKRWRARVSHGDKMIGAGSFENELDAARAVNAKCIELGIPLKNPDIPGSLTIKLKPKTPKPLTSNYTGVYYDKTRSRWRARFGHKGKEYTVGSFPNELMAARAVNTKCVQMGVSMRNPTVPDPKTLQPDDLLPKRKGRKGLGKKKYPCVFYNEKTGLYRARMVVGKTSYSLGSFSTDKEAACAVNSKCIELGLPIKIPERFFFTAEDWRAVDDMIIHVKKEEDYL